MIYMLLLNIYVIKNEILKIIFVILIKWLIDKVK